MQDQKVGSGENSRTSVSLSIKPACKLSTTSSSARRKETLPGRVHNTRRRTGCPCSFDIRRCATFFRLSACRLPGLSSKLSGGLPRIQRAAGAGKPQRTCQKASDSTKSCCRQYSSADASTALSWALCRAREVVLASEDCERQIGCPISWTKRDSE